MVPEVLRLAGLKLHRGWLLAHFRTTFAVGDTTWVYSRTRTKKRVNFLIAPSVSNSIYLQSILAHQRIQLNQMELSEQ